MIYKRAGLTVKIYQYKDGGVKCSISGSVIMTSDIDDKPAAY